MSEYSDTPHASPISAQPVDEMPDASAVDYAMRAEPFGNGFRIFLTSPSLRVELLTFGAAINSVQVRNPNKTRGDPDEWLEVALGYANEEECTAPGSCVGFTSGRYAGCISAGEFDLNGTNYKLLQNMGQHTLNGGPEGFRRKQWKYLATEGRDEIGVAFHLTSPHLDQGFPGELFVTATYTIQKRADHPTLKYTLQAVLSEHTPVSATVVNVSNHTYWNLNGVGRPASKDAACLPLPDPVSNHGLQINAKYMAETDLEMIPTGTMLAIAGTVHDYSDMRCIADGMEATREAGREPYGYCDPVALETWDSTLREATTLYSPKTSLSMRISTTCPSVLVYTANHLPADADGRAGNRFQQHSGVCLECMYFPDSPNIDSFPSTKLAKGEAFQETTMHEFKFLAASPMR